MGGGGGVGQEIHGEGRELMAHAASSGTGRRVASSLLVERIADAEMVGQVFPVAVHLQSPALHRTGSGRGTLDLHSASVQESLLLASKLEALKEGKARSPTTVN